MAPRDQNDRSWSAELAQAVRRRRKELGLTQLELSDLAGCGPVFIYDLEGGRKQTLRMDKVLDVLGVLGLELSLGTGRQAFRVGEPLK